MAWTSPDVEDSCCIAWADCDGDLDLACAQKGPNRVYENVAAE